MIRILRASDGIVYPYFPSRVFELTCLLQWISVLLLCWCCRRYEPVLLLLMAGPPHTKLRQTFVGGSLASAICMTERT